METELDEYRKEISEMLVDSFGIACNANDFFAYAHADMVLVEASDLKWVLPIYREFGNDGLNACLSHIAKADPIKPWITEKFLQARARIIEMAPTVASEY